jgi:hypothetical protein
MEVGAAIKELEDYVCAHNESHNSVMVLHKINEETLMLFLAEKPIKEVVATVLIRKTSKSKVGQWISFTNAFTHWTMLYKVKFPSLSDMDSALTSGAYTDISNGGQFDIKALTAHL